MNCEKIFNDPRVVKVENEIVDLWENGNHWTPEGETRMQKLLHERWLILRDFNEYDDEMAHLLTSFNERLKSALTTLFERAQRVYDEYMSRDDCWGKWEITGKCFLDFEYPTGHPVQSERAKNVWDVLTTGGFEGLYDRGVTFELLWRKSDPEPRTLNEVLYLSEELDNWNIEGVDREWSSNMHLVYAFHNLYTHLSFSLYDLLWVREFNLEINLNFDDNLRL